MLATRGERGGKRQNAALDRLVVELEPAPEESPPRLARDEPVARKDVLVVPPLVRELLVPEEALPPALNRGVVQARGLVDRGGRVGSEEARELVSFVTNGVEPLGAEGDEVGGEARRRGEGRVELVRLGAEVRTEGADRLEGRRREGWEGGEGRDVGREGVGGGEEGAVLEVDEDVLEAAELARDVAEERVRLVCREGFRAVEAGAEVELREVGPGVGGEEVVEGEASVGGELELDERRGGRWRGEGGEFGAEGG